MHSANGFAEDFFFSCHQNSAFEDAAKSRFLHRKPELRTLNENVEHRRSPAESVAAAAVKYHWPPAVPR